VRVFVLIATVLAAATGFVALFVPHLLQLFGLQGTDPFIFRQAGAATFGYAIMGIMELRSRNWADMRCAILMAAVFNGFSLVASVVSLISGDPVFLPVLFGVSTLGVTVAAIVALRTDGGTRTAASR
jgi:ABC-type cobalamin transport system permease subunit